MTQFYIASLKHTIKDHEHITFWGRFWRGYVLVIKDGHTGRYCYGDATDLNDGESCIAIPTAAVEALLSPEPYYKPGARFYDTRGPVVDNTPANWVQLVAASLKDGRRVAKIKPEPYRGSRRSFAWTEPTTTCQCGTCRPASILDPGSMRMIVCATCGNKRCPHANDHRNACTNSNEIGQPGSSWEHVTRSATPDETMRFPGAA